MWLNAADKSFDSHASEERWLTMMSMILNSMKFRYNFHLSVKSQVHPIAIFMRSFFAFYFLAVLAVKFV